MKKVITLFLSLCLIGSLASTPTFALTTQQAKDLLQDYYVDEIPPAVFEAQSVEELLAALGDPYTVYMTQEEYQYFLDSVNGDTVVGIGVSIQTVFEGGFQVLSVLPNSPALSAGLMAGDRVIAVDGVTLSAGSDVRAALQGKEGSSLTVTITRQSDGKQHTYTMVRKAVAIPIVTYEQLGSAGLIDCTSFGESTPDTIEMALNALNQDVSVWIMDLRSNPGGNADAAASAAGLFIGKARMVYFGDSQDNYSYIYTMEDTPDLTNKPLIILTSKYSASASELFSAAARDHGFALSVGQRTYGKGVAQLAFDEDSIPALFDGDALKVTAYRFYSPDGTTNHIVGILPSLLISPENTPAVALLLSAPAPKQANNYLKLMIAGQEVYISIEEATSKENVAAFIELLEAIPPAAVLSKGAGQSTWTPTTPQKVADELDLPDTPRTFSDIFDSPYATEIQTLATYQLLDGYEDGTFHPQQTITRGEFCAMLTQAFALPANAAGPSYSDVSGNAWYAKGISAMASRGFISGYGDNSFHPDAPISYQEMLTVLGNMANWCNMNVRARSQVELTIGEWATYYDYADWAQIPARTLAQLNVADDTLAPTDLCTRQVAAGLLCQMMERLYLLWY